MVLVFLYGPPAVGKLTVANALVKLTGYRVFHNHATIDMLLTIFDWGHGPFVNLLQRFRIEMIGAAAASDIPGVIFTFMYARGHDDAFVRRVVRTVERHGGRVCFVRMTCDRKELLRRVRSQSRRDFRKITDPSSLRHLFKRYEVFSDVPYPGSFLIDTTHIRPTRAARLIAERFRLKRPAMRGKPSMKSRRL